MRVEAMTFHPITQQSKRHQLHCPSSRTNRIITIFCENISLSINKHNPEKNNSSEIIIKIACATNIPYMDN